jgi:hypothetical protein
MGKGSVSRCCLSHLDESMGVNGENALLTPNFSLVLVNDSL